MTTSHSQARHRSTANHTSALVASVAASTRGHRRRSAVIAASSGLLITMGLPSTAVAAQPDIEDRSATTSSIPAVPAAPQVTGGIAVASTAVLDLGLGALTVVDSSVAEKAEADRLAEQRAAEERAEAQRTAAASSVLASRGSVGDSSSRSASRSSGSVSGSAGVSNASSPAPAPSAGGSGAIAIGQRYTGTPYLWGGTTPSGFDCSGFIQYVHRQMGINLPRTAQAQASAGPRVSASEARPGDIVSFTGSGGVYHNGIYAGNGMMLDSPRAGKSIEMRKIWSSSIFFTRVS